MSGRAGRQKGTRAPRIDEIRLPELESGDPAVLVPGARIDGREFSRIEPARLELSGAVVMECSFHDMGADEADLGSGRVRDVVIARTRITSLRASRGDWRDVRFEDCRIGSAEVYESTWGSVHFVDCRLTYLNLRSVTLRDAAFTRCVIDELDLTDATAQNVAFTQTSIGALDVQRATLKDFDLRGAELHRITGLAQLRGVTISTTQLSLLAPLMAAELGLVVEDDDDR